MKPLPLSEWHEDIGTVLWWEFPLSVKGEPPYVGTPLDLGREIVVETTISTYSGQETKSHRFYVGGWPGYHTHWTPLPERPEAP
jgi:hypothetical protein